MPGPARLNAAAVFVDEPLARGWADRPAFRHRGRTLTYGAVADLTSRAGHVLAGLGVEIEQRVLLALDDSPAFVAAFWGALKLGAVAVPVNPLLGPEECAFILEDSRARVAVVEPAVAARLGAGAGGRRWLRHLIVAGPDWEGRLATAPATLEAADTVADDIAYWGYTSGSTGPPKAAVHAHADFVAAADLVGVGVFGLQAHDVVFSVSRMSFAFGLGNTLYFPARVGASALLVEGRLEPAAILALIAAERPTALFAVATVYARLLEAAAAGAPADLGSLRLCVSSGEALPPAVFDGWRERFGLELVDVVGSTEALHDFIANRPGTARRGAAGRVIPGFEARLVDDEGRPVAPGTVGHLLIRGPTTAPWYWNRRERTRATMLGEWLRTGDMMWQDADGWFYFAGRADDMLKVRGQWVSPAEVEGRLLEHPAVVEAAVVGRADTHGLIRPHAAVVLKAGPAPSAALAEELQAFVRAGLAGYKAPATVEFVDELPRTPTGKLQRFRLRRP